MLVFILGAFVFYKNLRKDLVASEGEANLFGLVSVKGVAILLLAALLVTGMIYAFPSVDNSAIEALRADLVEAETRQQELEQILESVEARDIAQIVASLDPVDDLSRQLRGIQQNARGPWSPFSSSTPILFSVPGTNAEDHTYQRVVYGCGPYYQREVQVISDSEDSRGSTIEVTVTGAINNATNCAELAGGVDLQLDCDSATALLTSQVLTCDENGNPLWSESMRGQEKRFPAFIVILVP